MVTDKKINYFPSLLKEARKDFPLLIVVCPMEKDYSNPYKRATASYLCNTIAMFKGCLLGPNCCYGNGTVLLKDCLKLGL